MSAPTLFQVNASVAAALAVHARIEARRGPSTMTDSDERSTKGRSRADRGRSQQTFDSVTNATEIAPARAMEREHAERIAGAGAAPPRPTAFAPLCAPCVGAGLTRPAVTTVGGTAMCADCARTVYGATRGTRS